MDALSILDVANLFLRNRRLFVILPVVLMTLILVVALLLPAKFTTSASFLPVTGDQSTASKLAGLAAQFGFSSGSGSSAQSPQFYVNLLTSPEILRPAVQSQYVIGSGSDSVRSDLVQLWKADGDTPQARVEDAMDALRDAMSAKADLSTGLVTFTVTTRSPELSRQISTRLMSLINDFNVRARQSRAQAEEAFIGDRVDQLQRELRQAEDALQQFLIRNREYRGDPQLSFQYDRLQRDVDMRQAMLTTVVQSYDQARMEAVRNTPSTTTVMAPVAPARPDDRDIVLKLLLAMATGLALATAVAFFRELMRRQQVRNVAEYEEFLRLKAATTRELLRLARRGSGTS